MIKLNLDVALRGGDCFMSVVAWNSVGEVCSVQVFKERCNIPVAVECLRILKVVQIAVQEVWKSVIF